MLPLQLLNVIAIIVVLYFVIDLFSSNKSGSSDSATAGETAHRVSDSTTGLDTPEISKHDHLPAHTGTGQDGRPLPAHP